MRILVVGGFGFVGGRLAMHLAQAGHQIVLGSRNASSPPDWLPQSEVAQMLWEDDRALERICSRADVVIHAAGMNAQNCAAEPVAALAFNGLATARLLSAATRAGVARYIYLSTAHVYANPLVGTITEESCPLNLHPYATSHLAGEHAVLRANQLGQIQGIVLRLSNAFGAPTHKHANCWMLLVNDLCKQALETRKLVVNSSGLQQRDFIGISEVCGVAERLAVIDGGSVQTGIFNVGSGVSQSVFAMAQLIQQRCELVLGFKPDLQRVQGEAGERQHMLSYRTDKLSSIGFKSIGLDNTPEIDRLILFCQSNFHKTQTSRE